MILAIVGCHQWKDPATAESLAKLRIRADLTMFQPSMVISGGSEGIDTWAEQVAAELGITFKPLLPKVRRWTPDGYRERNLEIANLCTDLTCIRCSVSRPCEVSGTFFGSAWTAKEAEKLGKNVRRIVL